MPPVRNGTLQRVLLQTNVRVSGAAALWELYPCLLPGITFRVVALYLPRHSVRKGSQVQDSAGALSLGIPCTGSYYGNL
jgi:hypothetical protein